MKNRKEFGIIFCIVICLSLFWTIMSFAGDENCHGLYSPGNRFECGIGNGNCTWYAAYKRPDLNFVTEGNHNAGTWIEHAKKQGFVIGDIPVQGAVAVISMGSYGHVVYVEDRYQGPVTVDYGLPFIATEQDYTGSFKYKSIGNKTFEAIYAFSKTGYYKRQNSENGFGNENEVYGFIYPTFTIRHPDGRLVMMREDGRVPERCDDVDKGTFYGLDDNKRLNVAINLSAQDVYDLCEESLEFYHEMSIKNLEANLGLYVAKRKELVISDGIGGSETENSETGSEGEETQPSDLTIKSCKVRINGETGFQHKIQKSLRPNEFFTFDAEAKVKNKGNSTSYNADLDYRVDLHKDRFDENDTNLGDDEIDINSGETVTEYKRNIKVAVSNNKKLIKL